jgi:mxaJ protein
VLVTRKDRNLRIASLLDPRLTTLRIGIHRAGDGYTPPAIALGQNGHGANLVSYSLFPQEGESNAAAKPLDAVAGGEIDAAVVWGPLAGYFAAREPAALDITAVTPAEFDGVPFTYPISIAVAKSNDALRARIDSALSADCRAIAALLDEYHVPQVPFGKGGRACEPSSPPLVSSH